MDFLDDDTGERTRILVDPWLSDHATGDGMGRFPRLRFDMQALGPIHGVFLTHAHCDHLDPYTLTRLWRELATPPVLLLPITLAYLVPIFREFLEDCQIGLIEADTPLTFGGVDLFGFYDISEAPTNEDDVMVLAIRHGTETVLIEADANLSLEHPAFRAIVSMLLTEEGMTSAVFLTTENELTGTMESRTCRSLQERAELADLAMQEMVDAVQALYDPVDDPGDLWNNAHVLRLVHGQGLTAPHELDPRWQHILFPVRIEDRVREEQATAARLGLRHSIGSLTVGSVHTITDGRIQAVTPLDGLTLLDDEAQRTYDPHLAFFPDLPCAPLRQDPRDVAAQRTRILTLLNQRFLPYLHGVRQPAVLHLLADHGGTYRIRVQFGASVDDGALDYVLGFGTRNFVEVTPDGPLPQETYWANDLEDFLDGRCDEFSTFCRRQVPGQEIRLWACLATPLLNSDLFAKRVRHHFERAREGLTPGSYVLDLFEGGGGPPVHPHEPNTLFIEVTGAGLPEVDGLFVPSTAPPAASESGTTSSPGYWNGKMAWDRADGRGERQPALSYSNSYRSWRICRLDGHLAYDITTEEDLPPTDRDWHVYKKGVAPAPKVVIHHVDPRLALPEPNVVFVLGGPGSGKGTMCALAQDQLGWTHLSAGDLLRAAREEGGPLADTIEACITAGEIVPSGITVRLLDQAMRRAMRETGSVNFLLDGFPRSLDNLEAWHEVHGRDATLPAMLYFECPYEVLEQRILGRARFTGRSDDNVESMKQRFDTFKAKTLPTLEHFHRAHRVTRVDASQSRQAVYAVVAEALAAHTDPALAAQPLTEHSEMLLGLRPFPSKA